ncbi:hypothetical protein L2E82_21176 [Cichorium intybus]|uniref:Uncharacterized protein n=1 Tax=Cichorium intybus TaxID=13427 RepID=A0ACB9DVU3_CICIN|nr:hypothetical protein L2E82_21176 [Cichorium intybus]
MDPLPTQLDEDNLFLDFERLEDISNDEMIIMCILLNTKVDDPSQSDPSQKEWSLDQSFKEIDALMDIITLQPSMILPSESMQAESQVINLHLLMAYCEAVEKELIVLADAIDKRLIKKANPMRELTERSLYYLFQTHHKQFDYLKQECMKNFRVCSRAFYQLLLIFNYG